MQNNDAIYRSQIEPIIKQLDMICTEHEIPFVLVFQTREDEHVRSAFLPPDAHKEMRQLWEWLELGE